MKQEIMVLKPIFKEMLWGGNKLEKEFGFSIPGDKTGEAWLIAAHKNGDCQVQGGAYDGMKLSQLWESHRELFGTVESDRFPLLIKMIDANDDLSIQVHPDDAYAQKNENGEFGKTEMWYVMDAEEDAGLIYGFRKDLTKEEFRDAIEQNTLLESVNFVKCEKGDCFFIPSGMLHAIGKGLLIAEIQQNSDTTYRVYDYDRRDAEGNPRQLHVEKAIDVTNLFGIEPPVQTHQDGVLVRCQYFTTEKISVDGKMTLLPQEDRFEILIVCEGSVAIGQRTYQKGDTLLVPAGAGELIMDGLATLLRSYV